MSVTASMTGQQSGARTFVPGGASSVKSPITPHRRAFAAVSLQDTAVNGLCETMRDIYGEYQL